MQDYNKSENYINRELSWLDFNLRVLHEARDKENPLFERLKFLAITSSNLDEFFMVRVASLKNMEISDYKKKDASGLTPHEQLEKISEKREKPKRQSTIASARRKSPAGAGLFLIDMVEWARVMKRCWNAGKWIEIW